MKSSDTTDEKGPFYTLRHALVIEVAGALCLAIAVFVSHAWRRQVWEERRSQIPKATVQDMLFWLHTKPNPVFKKKPWRRSPQSHSFGSHRAASDEGRREVRGEEVLPVLDINHATTSEWERLPGWGEVLSKRTVKFRQALGGFVSIEQLKLVYGLDPDVVEENRPFLKVEEWGTKSNVSGHLVFPSAGGTPTVRCESNETGAPCSRSDLVQHGCVLGAAFPGFNGTCEVGALFEQMSSGVRCGV